MFSEEHKAKISQAHLARKADIMNEICEMAKAGKTTKEIASFFNKTPQNINKILSKRGVKSVRGVNPKKGISTTPEKIAEICEMAKAGKAAQEIADYYNVQGYHHSAGHIYKILDSQGIALSRYPNGKPNSNPQKKTEICDMFRNGIPIKEIAEAYQCSDGYVSRVLVENNLRSHKPKRTDGYTCDTQGYLWVRIPDDDPMVSMRTKHGIILEHRLVMARKLGRPLLPSETVHHIDGNKQNNHPDNLQLCIAKHGVGQNMICSECGSNNITLGDWMQCNNCNSTKIKFANLK